MRSPRFLLALAAVVLGLPAARTATVVEQAADAIKQGEFSHAEDLLTPLAAAKHPDATVLFYFSKVRFAQKQNEEAIQLLERAIKADPSKLEYYMLLGAECGAHLPEVSPMEGNAVAIKMRKAYEKVIERDPKNLTALQGIIMFYERAPEIAGGSQKKAREFAERVRAIDIHTGELELGRLAAGQMNFEEALVHYEAAVKAMPSDLATAAACGWTLFQLGRKDEARARFQAVLAVDPEFAPAKMGLEKTAPPAH